MIKAQAKFCVKQQDVNFPKVFFRQLFNDSTAAEEITMKEENWVA